MSDKELIKQEIERIEQILDDFNKTHNNTIDNGIVSAKRNICKHIKSFINSIPEVSTDEANCTPKSDDLEKEINNYIKDNFFGSGSMGFFSNRTKQELNSIDVANIAHHFAEWQKERDYLQYSHVRLKDVKDAWQTLKKNKPDIESYPPICFVKGAEWQNHKMKETLQTEYEKGRFDMREEMMKGAVEG